VKFKIYAQDSLTSLSSLTSDNVDFAAVGTMQGFEDKFDFLELGQEQLVTIVPCNHTLAKSKTVKLTQLVEYAFIIREETSGTRKEIERLLSSIGLPPAGLKVALELGSTESVITAVSEGRGISIISSIAAKKAQAAGLVSVLEIEEAKNSRRLYMARQNKPLIKACEVFWEFCRQYRFKNQAAACSV
jgi:DNA-binding transcriptional LysR family regulator